MIRGFLVELIALEHTTTKTRIEDKISPKLLLIFQDCDSIFKLPPGIPPQCVFKPLFRFQELHWAKLWYNTTFHLSTHMTLYQAVYGRSLPPMISYGVNRSTNDSVEIQLMDRDTMIHTLKYHLALV